MISYNFLKRRPVKRIHYIGQDSFVSSGTALVELVILLPLVLFLVSAIIDLGFYLRERSEVLNSARHGAREASIYSTVTSGWTCSTTSRTCASTPSSNSLETAAWQGACNNRPTSGNTPWSNSEWTVAISCPNISSVPSAGGSADDNFNSAKVTVTRSGATKNCIMCLHSWVVPSVLSSSITFPLREP